MIEYMATQAHRITQKSNKHMSLIRKFQEEPPQEFHIHDVFKNKIDILHIPTENSFSDSMVSNVVFFIDGENFLTPQVLPADTVKQKGLLPKHLPTPYPGV